jgi:hypothetical protein
MRRLMMLLIALMAPPAPAWSALISADSDLGPGTVVRDTSTGLDWLKLPLTANLNFGQVLADMEPGGRFDGFRYSSIQEFMGGLIQPVLNSCTTGDRACRYAVVGNLIDLFGGNRNGFQALYALNEVLDTNPLRINSDAIVFELFTEPVPDYILDSQRFPVAATRQFDGHFIARETPALPEPGTLALLGIGALALVRRRFQR